MLGENKMYLYAASGKGNNGVNSLLGLLQDLVVFSQEVENTIEAQDNPQTKQKLEEIHKNLTENYNELLDMAKSGIGQIRKPVENNRSNPVIMNDNNNTIQNI